MSTETKTRVNPLTSLLAHESVKDEKQIIHKKIPVKENSRFGRLLVQSKDANRKYYWWCICDCGKTKSISGYSLQYGCSKSCGCLQLELATERATTHGYGVSKKGRLSPEYSAWCKMKDRCYNTTNNKYYRYGGRGISVHPKWIESFEDFFDYIGVRPSTKHSLDRPDNDGNYEPGNVRWATVYEQNNNRCSSVNVTYNGVTKRITDWVSELKLPQTSCYRKRKLGLTWQQIFNLYKV